MSDLYHDAIRVTATSLISGKTDCYHRRGEPIAESLFDIPLVKAFLEDEDIQEMTLVSTNIGFVRTLRKYYNSCPLPVIEEPRP